MGEDDSATGVLMPIRDIVDLVLVDNPSILGCNLHDSFKVIKGMAFFER